MISRRAGIIHFNVAVGSGPSRLNARITSTGIRGLARGVRDITSCNANFPSLALQTFVCVENLVIFCPPSPSLLPRESPIAPCYHPPGSSPARRHAWRNIKIHSYFLRCFSPSRDTPRPPSPTITSDQLPSSFVVGITKLSTSPFSTLLLRYSAMSSRPDATFAWYSGPTIPLQLGPYQLSSREFHEFLTTRGVDI